MNEIAIITGGNRGIGRATALELARAGVDVILTYHTHREEAEAVAASIAGLGRRALALQLDVGEIGTFGAFARAISAALRETWQRETFDVLINNGGLQIAQPFGKVTEDAFDRLIDVHFKGVFFLTQELAPLLADRGSIVNVSTGLTRFVSSGRAIYGAAKGAVEVLTRYLAQELGPRGIRVNTIAPGAIATDFSGGLLRDNEQFQKHIAGLTPLGRHGTAEDVAVAIAALVGPGSRFITAQRIEVSGGIHA